MQLVSGSVDGEQSAWGRLFAGLGSVDQAVHRKTTVFQMPLNGRSNLRIHGGSSGEQPHGLTAGYRDHRPFVRLIPFGTIQGYNPVWGSLTEEEDRELRLRLRVHHLCFPGDILGRSVRLPL